MISKVSHETEVIDQILVRDFARARVQRKIFGHLLAEVIKKGRCVSCGACIAVCPVDSIGMENDLPKLVGQCIGCGMCYPNCPVAEFDADEMENLVFGRTRGEGEANIGVHTAIHAVKANDATILERCQDGGAVSAILMQSLSEGGDGAVVTGLDEDGVWVAMPIVASTDKEILDSAGTKYTLSPTLCGVASAVREYAKERLTVVGIPCQMRGLSKSMTGAHAYARFKDAVRLKVGLFCTETFNHARLMEFLEKEGVEASEVNKFVIKKGRFIAYKGGEEVYNTKLSNMKEFVRSCCHVCGDFTAEFADLSVGSVGSPDGWSTVIVRSQRGEQALEAAEKAGLIKIKPVEEGKSGLGIIKRLAKRKKRKAASASSCAH